MLTIIEIPHLVGWVRGGRAAVEFEIELASEGLFLIRCLGGKSGCGGVADVDQRQFSLATVRR